MLIRNVSKADLDLFLQLVQEFYTGPATLHEPNLDYARRTFSEYVNGSQLVRIVILEVEGEAAGFAQLSFTWSNESGGLVVWLEELFVRPKYRGLRLGSQFMEWMLEEYKEVSRIRLEITPGNDGARRLYARYGFEKLDYEQMVWEHP